MKIIIPNQTQDNENRVAIDPSAVKKLIALGCDVVIAADAGAKTYYPDQAYIDQGATVATGEAFAKAWAEADILITLHMPEPEQLKQIRSGAILMGMLAPLSHHDQMRQLLDGHVTVFSMEFVPRISRAQAMDVLSSQANIGGYMAVIRGTQSCPKMMPMMITAAGTIAPSKVFILGAGVAGLQAIATAKRLGAVVEAYDVRPEVEEQVKSLGGRFVKLPTTRDDASAAGGYAKEQTDEDRQKQIELMTKHVAGADIVITTAALFGKAPPLLIPNDMLAQMAPGSVVVDMAADPTVGRGNCEATQPGSVIVTDHGITIDGTLNLPGLAPVHSSQMYANNMLAFLREIIKEKTITLNLEDDVQRGACIAHDGELTNELVKNALA